MKRNSGLPSQSSPVFTTPAVLDLRFTTVDITASLSAFGVWLLIVCRKLLYLGSAKAGEFRVSTDDNRGSFLRGGLIGERKLDEDASPKLQAGRIGLVLTRFVRPPEESLAHRRR